MEVGPQGQVFGRRGERILMPGVAESHNENRYGIPVSCTCPRRWRVRRQSAFLRRRMKITTPNKTAMTPAIRRIVVESIT